MVERIGDYAKNIAKRVSKIEGPSKIEPLSLLPEMARIAGEMVHNVLDAFAARIDRYHADRDFPSLDATIKAARDLGMRLGTRY